MPINEAAKQKLDTTIARYNELTDLLGSAQVVSDPENLAKLSKEFSELGPIARAHEEYATTLANLDNSKSALESETDEEMRAMYGEEIASLQTALEAREAALLEALFPDDSAKHGDVIIEIRAGAGGLEASLFVSDLHRMYTRYAELKGWKAEPMDSHPSPMGGFKEIIIAVKGKDAYRRLRWESGVHRVQRIPVTESGGRIHTSTSTVAILAEPDEVEINIDPKDLKIDTFRASSAGGQHVNKTSSAIRVTHLPTNLVVECQDERSQHQNKAKALRLLRARLLKMEEEKQQEEIARDRKNQVGTGDRSEKIRTYNYPQNRITDHRAGVSLYKLALIMEGDLDELLDGVIDFFKQNQE